MTLQLLLGDLLGLIFLLSLPFLPLIIVVQGCPTMEGAQVRVIIYLVGLIRAMPFPTHISLFELAHIHVVDISLRLLLIVAVHAHQKLDICHRHIHRCPHYVHLPPLIMDLHS